MTYYAPFSTKFKSSPASHIILIDNLHYARTHIRAGTVLGLNLYTKEKAAAPGAAEADVAQPPPTGIAAARPPPPPPKRADSVAAVGEILQVIRRIRRGNSPRWCDATGTWRRALMNDSI